MKTIINTYFLMKLIVLLLSPFKMEGQILNGSFEDNALTSNAINCPNGKFDSIMNNCFSFGYSGNIDIIKDPDFCNSTAEQGQWFIAMTGGGSDQLSMQLSQALTKGSPFKLTFYNKFCEVFPNVMSSEVQIGLSTIKDSFGTLLGTTRAPLSSDWMQNTFSFFAPCDGAYITIKLKTGTAHDTWVEFDDFTLSKSVSLNEYSLDSAILIYPNPAKDLINIQTSEPIREVKIYSSTGSLILTPEPSKTIDISRLSKGLYFIQVMQQGNIITTRKFTKSNF